MVDIALFVELNVTAEPPKQNLYCFFPQEYLFDIVQKYVNAVSFGLVFSLWPHGGADE